MAVRAGVGLVALMLATSAPGAVIYQETVTPDNGGTVATLSGSLTVTAVLTAGTVWVRSSIGPMLATRWMIDGQGSGCGGRTLVPTRTAIRCRA